MSFEYQQHVRLTAPLEHGELTLHAGVEGYVDRWWYNMTEREGFVSVRFHVHGGLLLPIAVPVAQLELVAAPFTRRDHRIERLVHGLGVVLTSCGSVASVILISIGAWLYLLDAVPCAIAGTAITIAVRQTRNKRR